MALVGTLKPPGEFEHLLTDHWPIPHANPPVSSVFGYIPLMVTWLRPFVLAIASLRLLPSNPFNFSLFNCGWTIWLGPFVLAIAGLWLGILESSPGRLTLGMSPGALHSSTRSLSTDCFLLVNVLRGVRLLAIKGIDTRFRVSPASSAETVLPLRRLVRCGGHSAQYMPN